MKIIIPALFLLFVLSGCMINTRLFTPRPETGTYNNESNSFDLGRIKFDILLNHNWDYNWDRKDEIISFHFLNNGLSSVIQVTSYTNNFDHYDLQWDDIKSIETQYLRYTKSRRKGSAEYHPIINVNIVKRGEFDCVRYYEKIMAAIPAAEYRTAFSGGYDEHISFTCIVPSQPEKLPMHTGMSQSIGPHAKPFDSEDILSHVIESISLNPNPPENPNSIPKREYPPWGQWGTKETIKR